jgi:CO/xanthine dehydrogenase FAD-binding subunit
MSGYLGVPARPQDCATDACGPDFLFSDAAYNQTVTSMRLREAAASERGLLTEDSVSPSPEEAATEARRCLTCSCYAVHPSDIAPALIALDAKIVTNKRTLGAEELFSVSIPGSTALSIDEIITEIRVPAPGPGVKSAFIKFAFRKSIDFPIVNCAVRVGGAEPRVCINAVAPAPYRARGAESVLAGREVIDVKTAEEAADAAVRDAHPFEDTRYKVQLARTMVKRALLAAVK